jgi:hypothetical protein
LLAGLLTPLLLAAGARACSVPVFRYALERWAPEPYPVTLFHRGPLTGQHAETAEWLDKLERGTDVRANIYLQRVDLDGEMSPREQALWDAHAGDELPRLVVHYPMTEPNSPPVWTGPLSPANAARIVDSPVRRELARRIIGGDSGVWLFVPSGDQAIDANCLQTIEKTTATLHENVQVTQADGAEDWPVSVPAEPLTFRLSTLVLRRDRADERFLLNMLTSGQIDSEQLAGRPLVIPVFGRGRALYLLTGAENITSDFLSELAWYLAGDCSCEIKAQNPGIDLLMTADWEAFYGERQVKDIKLPPLSGLAASLPPTGPAGDESGAGDDRTADVAATAGTGPARPAGRGDAATPPADTDDPTEASSPAGLMRNVAIGIGAALVVMTAAGLVLLRRKTGDA